MVPHVSDQVDSSVVVVSDRFRQSSLSYLSVLFVRQIDAGSNPIKCVEARQSISSPGPVEQFDWNVGLEVSREGPYFRVHLERKQPSDVSARLQSSTVYEQWIGRRTPCMTPK